MARRAPTRTPAAFARFAPLEGDRWYDVPDPVAVGAPPAPRARKRGKT